MTLKQYIDRIQLISSRLMVGVNLDTYELVQEINGARRNVQTELLPFIGNRFGDIIYYVFDSGITDNIS